MSIQTKIQSIDQKIADLKKRKAQVAQKNLQSLARLIQKCGLEDLTPETLTGALLDIKQHISQKGEGWQQAGEKFLGAKRSEKVPKAAGEDAEN